MSFIVCEQRLYEKTGINISVYYCMFCWDVIVPKMREFFKINK